MHVEITRLITGWLSDKDFGVKKQLETVGRLNLKGGTDPKPEIPTIYNDVDFDIATTLGVDPPTVPSLVVVADLDLRGTDTTQPKKSGLSYTATAGIGYYCDEVTKDKNIRDGNYILRAVMRSLVAYNFSPERSKAFRELNDIRIMQMIGMTVQRVAGAVPESRLLGMVFADLTILDKAP